MGRQFIQVADDFWNIRGSYKIAGVIDVGTQASLVRLASGKFVMLDCYTLNSTVKRQVGELTRGGEDIEAILNLHPFHTMHVKKIKQLYPQARLYGTTRHKTRFPDLPWMEDCTEDPVLHEAYANDFEFSIPRGVDFISDDENIHFSSVLVLHKSSQTIHSDDTLIYARLPGLVRLFGLGDSVGFHPTLAKALEKRPGAAKNFHDWAEQMIENWGAAKNLCAAHTAALLERENRGACIHDRLVEALKKVGSTLNAHERKYPS